MLINIQGWIIDTTKIYLISKVVTEYHDRDNPFCKRFQIRFLEGHEKDFAWYLKSDNDKYHNSVNWLDVKEFQCKPEEIRDRLVSIWNDQSDTSIIELK